MDNPHPTGRRWFQFGLGSLLWLIIVLALSLALFREHRRAASYEAMVHRLEKQNRSEKDLTAKVTELYSSESKRRMNLEVQLDGIRTGRTHTPPFP